MKAAGDRKDITGLLRRAVAGDREAESEVLVEVYDQLYRLARAILAREHNPNDTLQASALVNEAYLRLLRGAPLPLSGRLHFFRLAARCMRAILVDYARKRTSLKRGGTFRRLSLDNELVITAVECDLVLQVHEALERLNLLDERQAQIVELRFFGGLSEQEVAGALGISPRTVKREWIVAKSWLHAELSA